VKTLICVEQSIDQALKCFGSTSFREKTEVAAQVDGVVDKMPVREGDTVQAGQLILSLRNVQLETRQTQAKAARSQAASALELARARLWSGRLQVEARLAEVEKGELDYRQSSAELSELERLLKNKQSLFEAGGVSEETINNLKVSLAAKRTANQTMAKDLEIKRIGLRDNDLRSVGKVVPVDRDSRLMAIVELNTATLRAELDGAESRLEQAEAELAACKALIGEMTVKAPQAGIIGARNVSAGEFVQTAAKLVTIIDTQTVQVVFPVPEKEAVKLRSGMRAVVALDAWPDRSFEASIDQLSPLIDTQSGAVTVKALLPNPKGQIKPGMFARVSVVTGEALCRVVLPESCIVRKEGERAWVFTVTNGRVFTREIRLERDLGGQWMVGEGLKTGEVLVDSPSPLLREGMEVGV
jgi:RND family efflux transporter MFP subunit